MIDVEGLVLLNEPLSNIQLADATKKLEINQFMGVFVRDQLPKKSRIKECGILNTGDSSTNGFHWMCWYKNCDRKICFDSYGLPPPIELVDYLERPVYYNSERLQYGNTVYCGHLCLFVLKKLSDGMDIQDIINSLS